MKRRTDVLTEPNRQLHPLVRWIRSWGRTRRLREEKADRSVRSPSCGAIAWRRASAIARTQPPRATKQNQAPGAAGRRGAESSHQAQAPPSGPSGCRPDGDRLVIRSPGFLAGFCGGFGRCWGPV